MQPRTRELRAQYIPLVGTHLPPQKLLFGTMEQVGTELGWQKPPIIYNPGIASTADGGYRFMSTFIEAEIYGRTFQDIGLFDIRVLSGYQGEIPRWEDLLEELDASLRLRRIKPGKLEDLWTMFRRKLL